MPSLESWVKGQRRAEALQTGSWSRKGPRWRAGSWAVGAFPGGVWGPPPEGAAGPGARGRVDQSF